jgi:hypothetical protein
MLDHLTRRAWLAACLVTATLLSACTGDQKASPTEVISNSATASAAALSAAAACPTPGAVDRQIIAIVPVGKKIIAAADFDVIVLAYILGKKTAAQTAMFQLWSKVLAAYTAGQLVGGLSTSTATAVLALGKAFYCSVGLDGSTLTLGTSPTDSNNVVAVVFPSTKTQTVVTGNGVSGVMIPGNTLTAPTTITVTLIPGPFAEFAGPLNTKLDQFGPFFQYNAVPESAIGDTVVVSTCSSDPNLPASRVHLAHNVGTGFQILPLVPTFLNCSATSMAEPQGGVFARIGQRIADFFVADAYASTAIGVGGKTKSFSPFGIVDTMIAVQPNSPTQQQAPTGSAVTSPPSVSVQTLGAHTGIPGTGVVFAVTTGSGMLTATGSTTLVSQVSTATDSTGTASVGSWVVGLGQNIVNATATYPAVSGSVGVSVAGNPVADTAVGGDLIPYLGTGYKWMLGLSGDTVGFYLPSFSDANWSVGNAAFGSGSTATTTCPLDNTVATYWNNTVEPSAMLLRKSFPWPVNGTGTTTFTLGVAIDNDIQVYINGTDITSSVQGGTVSSDGFVHHSGCATQNSYTFSFTDAMLVAGNNLLAIRARDDGDIAYVDARLSVSGTTQQSAPASVGKVKKFKR